MSSYPDLFRDELEHALNGRFFVRQVSAVVTERLVVPEGHSIRTPRQTRMGSPLDG